MEGCSQDAPGNRVQTTTAPNTWDQPPPGVLEYLIRDHRIVSTLRLINSDWCKGVDGAVNRIALSESLPSADIENWVVALLKKFPCMDTVNCEGSGTLGILVDHFLGKVVHMETCANESDNWEMLPRFGKLETLRVNGRCSHNNLAHLSTMTTLKELTILSSGRDFNNPDALSCLTNLEKLVFEYCRINTLQFVESLTGLVELRLEGFYAQGSEYGVISALTNLTILDISCTDFDDGDVSCLSSLVNLEKLCFNAPKISDSGFCHVSNLAKLRHLSTYWCKLTEIGLNQIAFLGDLELLHIGYVRHGLRTGLFLIHLTKLRELHLNVLVETAVMKSIAALKCLTDLRVDVSLIGNDAFSLLGSLSHLETLHLANTCEKPKIRQDLLDWGCIPQVRRLELHGRGWVDGSLVNLSRMENLQELKIHSQWFTDWGMGHVTKVKKLHYLYCCSPQLSEKFKEKLSAGIAIFEHAIVL